MLEVQTLTRMLLKFKVLHLNGVPSYKFGFEEGSYKQLI